MAKTITSIASTHYTYPQMDGQAELAWSNARADVQSGLALAPQRFTSRHPLWADAAPVDITVQLKVGWQIL